VRLSEVFVIEPAPTRALVLLGALGILLLGLFLLVGYTIYSSRATRYELSSEGLVIDRTLYGRRFDWEELRLEEARPVDLRSEREFQPTFRTNGIGLPGYRAGWFRLRSSGRGLLFVTDPSRVLAIPTARGFTVLLTVGDPVGFLARMRHLAGGSPRQSG
jgi:hypothetical protein